MKRIKINPQAIKERLEKNKENKAKKREKISIADNPIFKIEEEGEHLFRAVYYPHSEDPASDPFPMRHYHYGIPGDRIIYCPRMNDGEDCALCDFLWEQMKANKGTPAVKVYSDHLPKARVWIPGKARGREAEGNKFLTIGSRHDKMSDNHNKIMSWFNRKATANWLDPDVGFDIILTYAKYEDGRAEKFGPIGLKSFELDRESTEFGDDFDTWVVPDIDDSPNDPVLKSYRKRTSDEMIEILKGWQSKLGSSDVPASKPSTKSTKSDMDTGSTDEDDGEETEEVSEDDIPSKSKSDIAAKLASFGIQMK